MQERSCNTKQIEQGVELILEGLGVDRQDENFKGTPERVARAYQELCGGLFGESKKLDEVERVFPAKKYDGLITESQIRTAGICPHHLLPVFYEIAIGYLPDGGKLLGVSKLARLAEALAHRPVLQEDLTADIADELMTRLKCKGCGVVISGFHSCIAIRGCRQADAIVTTSSVRGDFLKSPDLKNEFLRFVDRKTNAWENR